MKKLIIFLSLLIVVGCSATADNITDKYLEDSLTFIVEGKDLLSEINLNGNDYEEFTSMNNIRDLSSKFSALNETRSLLSDESQAELSNLLEIHEELETSINDYYSFHLDAQDDSTIYNEGNLTRHHNKVLNLINNFSKELNN